MPKDVTPLRPGAKQRLAAVFSTLGTRYDPATKLGIGEDTRGKITTMDPLDKTRPARITQAQLRRDSADLKRQMEILQKRADAERARGELAKEKKTMDELADLMNTAIPTTDQGPFREGSFAQTYERIVNKPYPTGARRTRRSKKTRKGGKKSRKPRA